MAFVPKTFYCHTTSYYLLYSESQRSTWLHVAERYVMRKSMSVVGCVTSFCQFKAIMCH